MGMRIGAVVLALLVTAGCGDDEGGGPMSPSPVDTATSSSPGQTRMPGMPGLGGEGGDEGLHSMSGPDARMAGKPTDTINFNDVNWEWNAKRTHLEPGSFPDARVLSNSNVWRRDNGTGLIRIFSNDDLSGFGFETAGGRWDLSMRRAGLYVSEITGTEVDRISSGGGGRGGRADPPTLQCDPSNTNPSGANRLGAIAPGVGTVSFLITVTCNRVAQQPAETSTIEAAGPAEHFYTGTSGTTEVTWVDKDGSASVAGGSNAPTPPLYNLSVNFDVERNDTGSLRTGRLVWEDGGTAVGERQVQQAAPTTECSLPTVSSFSARAVDPRHNRITWSLPGQASSCPYTRFELDVATPSRSSAVQISSDDSEYIHGALPSCPEDRCGALTDDEAVVTYKIRTTNYTSHNAGPWSREVTVNRSTVATPSAPLYMRAIHRDSGHVSLRWDEPAIPEDGAGVTYSVEAMSRGGWRSFTDFTDEDAKSRTISFADMPPVGVATDYTFRVRATHNGRSGPWSNETNPTRTWDAPGRVDVQISSTGSNLDGRGGVSLLFGFTGDDARHRRSYDTTHAGCEISVGNRSSYQLASSITGLDCLRHEEQGPYLGLRFNWSSAGMPVDQTIWIRFAVTRGTIKGPTQEIDITRTDADNDGTADNIVSQNATKPPSGGGTPTDPCARKSCNAKPDVPRGEPTYGNGSLTMRWTTTGTTDYSAGTDSVGDPVGTIRRLRMKYQSCPLRRDGHRLARIGPAFGQMGTFCVETAETTARGSTGTMTFRGSYGGTVNGHLVEGWGVTMFATAENSLANWSGWTVNGGQVTQD